MSDNFIFEIHKKMKPFHAEREGESLVAYLCPAGKLTVGRGHNCEASPVPGVRKVGDRITPEVMEQLYAADCARTVGHLDTFLPWWRGLSAPRAAVLFDMVFNMGIGYPPKVNNTGKTISPGRGLRSFVATLGLIEKGDYANAAKNLKASKWAKDVKGRAVIMIEQLETGKWQI